MSLSWEDDGFTMSNSTLKLNYSPPEPEPLPDELLGFEFEDPIPEFPHFESHIKPRMIMRVAHKQFSSAFESSLQRKGYSKGWIQAARNIMEKNKDLVKTYENKEATLDPKALFVARTLGKQWRGKSNRVSYNVDLTEKGSGKVSTIWAPKTNARYARTYPKPSFENYSQVSFKRWVNSHVAILEPTLQKTQVVSGNLATEALYYAKGRSPGLKKLLSEATLYIDDYNYKGNAPPLPILHALSGFVVNGKSVSSMAELASVAPLFKRHKPLFRLMSQSLIEQNVGERTIDVSRLQRSLDIAFPPLVEVKEESQIEFAHQGPVELPPRQPLPAEVLRDVPIPSITRPVSREFFPPPKSAFRKEKSKWDEVVWKRKARRAKAVNLMGPQRAKSEVREEELEGTLKLQGQGISHQIRVTGSEGQSIAEEVKEIFSEFSEGLTNQFERPFIQLAALLVSLYQAENWKAALASVIQYVASNDVIYQKVRSFFAKVPDVLTPQGGFEFAHIKTEFLQPIWEAITTCFTMEVVSGLFASTKELFVVPIIEMIKACKFALNKEIGTNFAKTILSFISDVLRRLKQCWKLKSLAPLWKNWDPDQWYVHSENMLAYFPVLTISSADVNDDKTLKRLREEGKIPSCWTSPVSIAEYQRRLEDMKELGRRMQAYFSSDRSLAASIQRMCDKLQSMIELMIASRCTADERVSPLVIYLYGQQGVGKTLAAAQLGQAVAHRKGYDAKDGTYFVQPEMNFQSGFTHQHWLVVFDDPDQGVAPPVAGIPTPVAMVVALANNKPYQIEQSDNNVKGKVHANPLLLLYCSNFETGRAEQFSAFPQAFYRRIGIHATVTVKPEFATQNGELDKAKAEMSETHNLHFFEVKTYTGNPSSPFGNPKVMEFSEFVCFVHERFDDHLRREYVILKQRAGDGPRCPICFLATDRSCGCDVPSEKLENTVKLQGKCGDLTQAASEYLKGVSVSLKNGLDVRFQRFLEWAPLVTRDFIGYVDQRAYEVFTRLLKNFSFRMACTIGVAIASIGALAAVVKACMVMRHFQGREMNSTGNAPDSWFRADQKYIPGLPPISFATSYGRGDLVEHVKRCMFQVQGPHFKMWCLAISHNAIVVPTHVGFTKTGTSYLGNNITVLCDKPAVVQLHHLNCRVLPSNKELMVVVVPGLKGSKSILGMTWKVVDEQISQFDDVEIWSNEKEYDPNSNKIMSASGVRVLTTNAITKDGDCGMVYLARFGWSWRIVAMHYALNEGIVSASCSVAGLLTEMEIESVLQSLATTFQGVVTPSELISETPRTYTHFPVMSEVNAAISHYDVSVNPVGTLHPKIASSSMKSKVSRKYCASYFEDLELEWTGQVGYWQPPSFLGEKRDGKWWSPYIHSFVPDPKEPIDPLRFWMCIADYLSGMERLDNSGYSVLSESQAVVGIPASYVHSINCNTSVGPPFFGSKRQHYSLELPGLMSPQVCSLKDVIRNAMDDGLIVAPFANVTLKDEALKPGKVPRTFQNLSSSINIIHKQYSSPIKSFMRANFGFFECAVGINMTSGDASKLVQHLSRVDPSLENLTDGDVSRLDKSYRGEYFEADAYIDYGVGWYIGCAPRRSYEISHGLKHTLYCIKGDVFHTFWNPSGNDKTVEINSKIMSIGDRYCYYQSVPTEAIPYLTNYVQNFFSNPIPDGDLSKFCTYRRDNALVTYGDDFLKNSRLPLSPRYTQEWKEFGLTVTDASKGEFRRKSLHEVQFLKRNLVFSKEFDQYITPLDKKSLARTLVIKKDTSLSDRDDACESMSQVLREAVYHGEVFYNRLRDKFLDVADKLHLSGPYLELPPYSQRADEVRQGVFKTWTNRETPLIDTLL